MAMQAYTVVLSLDTAIALWNSNVSVRVSPFTISMDISTSVSTPENTQAGYWGKLWCWKLIRKFFWSDHFQFQVMFYVICVKKVWIRTSNNKERTNNISLYVNDIHFDNMKFRTLGYQDISQKCIGNILPGMVCVLLKIIIRSPSLLMSITSKFAFNLSTGYLQEKTILDSKAVS